MKMKITIKSLALASLMMFGAALNAQQVNVKTVTGTTNNLRIGNTYTAKASAPQKQDLSQLPKMERDIIILQNVLDDMFSSNDYFRLSSSSSNKGIHIPDKGVIFNLGDNNNYSFRSSIVLRGTAELIYADKINTENKKEEVDVQAVNKERENELISLSQEFLLNYGSILSELKNDDQIMLNVKYSPMLEDSKQAYKTQNTDFFGRSSKSNTKRITSSIQFKDLKDLMSGKLTFEAAKTKVKTTIVDDVSSERSDTKIMAGILDDLFESTFDGTYRKSGRTSWTYFEGFGLMYNLSISPSSTVSSRVVFLSKQSLSINLDEDQKKERDDQARNAIIALDDLIDLAKESLVTYGRTLRSVKSDEAIILNLNFNGFYEAGKLPKSVRITVNKSQIDQLSKGGISLEQLKKEIDVKKLTSSLTDNDHRLYSNFPSDHFNSEVKPLDFPKVKSQVENRN